MRCASCGMENAPDSRFCGGCGARQPSSAEQPRLAPTAKIPDEAPYPQQAARPTVVPQGPVSYAPPSIPPPSVATPAPVSAAPVAAPLSTPPPGSLVRREAQQPASQPPVSQQQPVSQPPAARPASQPPRAAPKPHVSSTSASFAVPPRRPIGLMVALVILDIGLAAGGAVLMSKGLAAKSDKKPAEKKTEAPATNADAPVIDTAASAASAAANGAAPVAANVAAPSVPTTVTAPVLEAPPKPQPPANDVGAAAREAPKRGASEGKLADKRPESTKVVDEKLADKRPEPAKVVDEKPVEKPADTNDKPVAKPDDAKAVPLVPTQPQDPYAAPNTEQEIEAQAAGSKADFAACAKDHPGHGSIKVAFQVRYDGRVINAAAVENTTGSSELARCLVAEISSWKVSAHNGTSINMLRPFTYP